MAEAIASRRKALVRPAPGPGPVAPDVEFGDLWRLVAPGASDMGDDGGHVTVAQDHLERRHAERPRVAGCRRREPATQHHLDQVGDIHHAHRAVGRQRGVGQADALTLLAMAVGTMPAVEPRPRFGAP